MSKTERAFAEETASKDVWWKGCTAIRNKRSLSVYCEVQMQPSLPSERLEWESLYQHRVGTALSRGSRVGTALSRGTDHELTWTRTPSWFSISRYQPAYWLWTSNKRWNPQCHQIPVVDFTYLGGVILKESGSHHDIKARLLGSPEMSFVHCHYLLFLSSGLLRLLLLF